MPQIEYRVHNFRKQARLLIDIANNIIADYQADGYDLTLRQLYYQFVARDIIPNSQKEYDKLGSIISKARLAGLIDWDAIVDRTRTTNANQHFEDPSDILTVAAESYQIDSRADLDFYVEVWIEKEALLGVIGPICSQLDVTYLACKGYYSQSAMWRASQRIQSIQECGKEIVILHLGDHDPSGIDMTRDIEERLALFGVNAEVRRIALNMQQVEQYNPPPNFAKLTDTRAGEYIAEYGRESWELDALDPKVITGLINHAVSEYTDQSKRQALINLQESQKQSLTYIADHWQEIEIE